LKRLDEFTERSIALRYIAAAGFSGLALLLPTGVHPILVDRLPFVTFLAAVTAAALFGGRGPGILSAAVGFVAAEFFSVHYGHSGWPPTPIDLVFAASYVLIALGIVLSCQAMQDARRHTLARQIGLAREVEDVIRKEAPLREAYAESESRVRDRTEELGHARAALERERRRSHKILELLPMSVALLTADRHISFANRAFAARFGGEHGRRCFQTAVEHGPCEFCETYRVLETGVPHVWEYTGTDDRTWRVFAIPYSDLDGSRLILEVRTDITEMKQALATALQRAALLHLAFDAIVFINLNGEIVSWNRGAEELYGWRTEEAVGKDAHRLLKTKFPVPMEQVKATVYEQGRWEGELVQMNRLGQTVIVESRWSLQRGVGEKPSAVLEINRDVSDRNRSREALASQSIELERSNRELQQFAYTASHDLQEPLRMVANFTQLLSDRYAPQLDEDAREFIAFALSGAVRMQGLIQDLLAYSRVGSRKSNLGPVDCNELLGRAISNLRTSIAENDALITHDELPEIPMDGTQLVQVFQNLISNGIKFKGSIPPVLHVSAVRNGSEWVFSVRDRGIGIDPRYSQRIFGLFQRLHRTEDFPGTGIGLAICKKIVESHGGKIWVESKPQAGSTFFFSIPIDGTKAETGNRVLESTIL
jgi:PAS domain S-box-containing protein